MKYSIEEIRYFVKLVESENWDRLHLSRRLKYFKALEILEGLNND